MYQSVTGQHSDKVVIYFVIQRMQSVAQRPLLALTDLMLSYVCDCVQDRLHGRLLQLGRRRRYTDEIFRHLEECACAVGRTALVPVLVLCDVPLCSNPNRCGLQGIVRQQVSVKQQVGPPGHGKGDTVFLERAGFRLACNHLPTQLGFYRMRVCSKVKSWRMPRASFTSNSGL